MPRLHRTASRYLSPPDSFGGRGGFESTLSNSFSGGPSESKRSISTPAPVSIEAFYEGRAAASTAPLRLKRAEKRQDRGLRSCHHFCLVAHGGFEPPISALRGRCPGPLDECATCACPTAGGAAKSDALQGTAIVPSLAGEGGFEPPHTDPESAVLPLDDSPISRDSSTGIRLAQMLMPLERPAYPAPAPAGPGSAPAPGWPCSGRGAAPPSCP